MSDTVLADVAQVVMGQSPDGATYNKNGIGFPLLNGPAEFGGLIPMAVQWTTDPAKFAESGDILFCVRGNTLGRQNIADQRYAIGRGLAAIRARDGKADTDYIGLWLRYRAASLLAAGNGSTFPSVSGDYLESLPFPEISASEQRQAAASLKAQLAEVETARQAVQAQRMDVEGLLLALYREAFVQIAPVAVPPTFDDSPPGWQWHKLTDIARLESGHTPSRSRPDWWGGDVSWISLTEIRALDGQWVEGTQLRTNAAGVANSAARILPHGTVCYSRTASVGFVAIMAQPMATSQDFANWVCSDALDPEFLMHALIRARKELRALATGATHKTIYMPTLESFRVCAPDPDTQRRIVRALKQRLADATTLRAALDAQRAELENLPQRLLAQAFE